MKNRITNVIHIMTNPPAYDEYADQPKPDINWTTTDGSWVGIWGYDWADILAIEVRKICSDINHEIWQPDLRADKVYSEEIYPGVHHKLFPAVKKNQWVGLKRNQKIYSPGMLGFLNNIDHQNLLFHIGRHLINPINKALLACYKRSTFVASFHGEIYMPKFYLRKFQKNFLSKIYYLIIHFQSLRLFRQISCVTIQSKKNLEDLKSYYNGPIERMTMGIKFDEFNALDKTKCRNKLNLPIDKKILITMCFLNERKQIDKLIEVFSKIKNDFLFIIMGHGKKKYEKYLKNKAKKLFEGKKIMIVGYRRGSEKIEYLSASDLFVHVSKSEAGPVVNMEAMALGLPIFTTNTGHTAEFLAEHGAGCVVGIHDYKNWQTMLEKFLNGQNFPTIDIGLAKRQYDWENIAHRCLAVYHQALNKGRKIA